MNKKKIKHLKENLQINKNKNMNIKTIQIIKKKIIINKWNVFVNGNKIKFNDNNLKNEIKENINNIEEHDEIKIFKQ